MPFVPLAPYPPSPLRRLPLRSVAAPSTRVHGRVEGTDHDVGVPCDRAIHVLRVERRANPRLVAVLELPC